MENLYLIGGIIIGIILLIVVLKVMYVKAPPSYAYILSGICKEPRVFIGTGGFQVPILERLDNVYLGQLTVDIKTARPIPTHDFIDVKVDAVCKVRVIPTEEGIRLAAKNFLNMSETAISESVRDSLEGNMRELISAMDLQKLVTDRDTFSTQVQEKAAVDMAKLGLEILSCNIQNITDEKGLIQDLGADNTYKIKKDAAINKANAEKEIQIAQSDAKKAANDVQVKNETEIAERNNELAIRKADLQKQSDSKKAEADAAYEIQKQEQLKTINERTVEAEISRTVKEQQLAEEQVKVTENRLKAEVNAKADADKYNIEVEAKAKLEQQKREAEAKAYLAEQEAKAIKAKADAAKYAALQEAEGIKAKGIAEAEATQAKLTAEAEGIRAKGDAEAEAMDKKAEAYKKSEFAKLEMILEMQKSVLPQVAENVAKPMSAINDVTIYGQNGSEISGISQNVPVVMKKTFDIVKDTTGVDLADVMKSETIEAKVTKNVNLNGAVDVD